MATFKAPQETSDADRFKQKFPGHGVPKQSDFLRKRLQGKGGGQYFDSGDYNMQRSSKNKDSTIVVGKAIPNPATIPQRKQSSSKQSSLIEGETLSPHSTDEKVVVVAEEQISKEATVDN